jgi:hypothetical protein
VPSSEDPGLKTDEERLSDFIENYGTHYVQSIRFGYKIAIYASYDDKYSAETTDFQVAFKASFGDGGAGRALTDKQKTIMRSSHVDLKAEITAGGLNPPASFIMDKFDDITPFLEGIRSGTITIDRGPIGIIALSYRSTLKPEWKTRALFAPNAGQVADAPFGVPAGTIIAWSPPDSAMGRNPDGTPYLRPPAGWAICDGSNAATPNLLDRFISGTADLKEIRVSGGAASHVHTATQNPIYVNDRIDYTTGPGYFDIVTKTQNPPIIIGPSSNLPPFLKLVYLMKL